MSIEFCILNGDVSEYENEVLPMFTSDRAVPQLSESARSQSIFKKNSKLFITLFGRTADEKSIAIVINDWFFHFFVQLSDQMSLDLDRTVAALRLSLPRGTLVSVERRFPAVGFQCGPDGSRATTVFVRLSFSSLSKAYIARKFLQAANYTVCEDDTFSSTHHKVFILSQFFEHMSASFQTGEPCSWFSWLRVRRFPYGGRPASRFTHCHYEAILSFHDLELLPPRVSIPALRVLSFDIECYSDNDNVFPVADKCPVVAIGCSVYRFDPCGDCSIVQRICFSCGSDICPAETLVEHGVPMPDSSELFEHRTFASEIAMLEMFRDYFVAADIDWLTGYNIWMFDIPYLLDRVRKISPESRFFRLGKILQASVDNRGAKPSTFSSTAMGDNDQTLLKAPGISEIDVYIQAKKRKGFSSFKLGAVASKVLGFTKIDFSHIDINRCYRAGNHRDIASYCVRDTELPPLIMESWGAFQVNLAISRVTATPVTSLCSAGQTVMVRNILHRTAHLSGFVYNDVVFPVVKVQGAIVIEPVPGYYLDHVATLDYNSLYPSCIIMGNLCTSTLILDDANLNDNVETLAVLDHRFVQGVVGIVPAMLSGLLEARNRTKKLMANAKASDLPGEARLHDYHQLALKLCANSVYGIFNSPGRLRCTAVAEGTTALGRIAIEKAREIAEGPPYNGAVIYGDTDSIMIRLPGANTLQQDHDIATKIAADVTAFYCRKLILVPEKIYCPYLLAKKKRYCGLMYTSPTSLPTEPDCKGFEIVRKDSFPYCHELQSRLFSILVAPLDKSVVAQSLGLRSLELVAEKRRLDAVALVREFVLDLQERRVDTSQLVLSKSLRREYKNEGSVVQAVVNKQIGVLTPGREFPPGDRVSFFILSGVVEVHTGREPVLRSKTNSLADRAVYSEFFTRYPVFSENLDWAYYIERLRPTVHQVMSLVSPRHIADIDRIFAQAMVHIDRTTRKFSNHNHREIASFFNTPTPSPAVAHPLLPPGDDPPVRFAAPSLALPAIQQKLHILPCEPVASSGGVKRPAAFACSGVALPPAKKCRPLPAAPKKMVVVSSIKNFFAAKK